jgi:phosphoglycerate dehydrogenase-like enzyme
MIGRADDAPKRSRPATGSPPGFVNNKCMVIGFLGLGQMGREMAARLAGAGHDLVVWNRSAAAAERFRGKARIAAPRW